MSPHTAHKITIALGTYGAADIQLAEEVWTFRLLGGPLGRMAERIRSKVGRLANAPLRGSSEALEPILTTELVDGGTACELRFQAAQG